MQVNVTPGNFSFATFMISGGTSFNSISVFGAPRAAGND